MVREFDDYILDFSTEKFSMDYWYDEGVDIVQKMMQEFSDNDWKTLLEIIPNRTVEWKKRLAYCMHDGSDLRQFNVLLSLVDTNNTELFEIVVDSLRSFVNKENIEMINCNDYIITRINELEPQGGKVTNKVFKEFTDRFYRSRTSNNC